MEADAVLPRLGITTGDPAGIGPEISLRAAAEVEFSRNTRLLLFGGLELLRTRAAALGLPFQFESVAFDYLLSGQTLPWRGIVDIPAAGIVAGAGSAAAGSAAALNIMRCTEACQRGALDAIVTAPINKKYFQAAGYDFPGHTEFLAHLCGVDEIAMAFFTEHLKVVLATIHDSMRTVIDMVSPELILRKLSIILTQFPLMGLPCARIAVAGLNPHAGEGGLMGSEEETKILPGIIKARKKFPQAQISDPLPGDTVFYRAYNGEFDVVLAMYHDQGLAPIKLIGFGESVNITLGLPIIRTSVDHGTAYELAGRGTARSDSMNSAIRWARRLAASRRHFTTG